VYNQRVPRLFPSCVLAGTALLAAIAPAQQQTPHRSSVYQSISGTGTDVFLGLGILLPLIQDGSEGTPHTLRALDSTLLAGGLAFGLEVATKERTPNGLHTDSFPSMHTSVAFAVATMQAQFHPTWEAPLWYAGAALIGVSRVQLHEHHWGDVFAGAGLGYGVARIELSFPRGILVYPFMSDDGGPGLAFSAKF
jgi:membrane-associated phospholipid phosphatase